MGLASCYENADDPFSLFSFVNNAQLYSLKRFKKVVIPSSVEQNVT